MAVIRKREAASASAITPESRAEVALAGSQSSTVSSPTEQDSSVQNRRGPQAGQSDAVAVIPGDRLIQLGRDKFMKLSVAKEREGVLVELLQSEETKKALLTVTSDPVKFVQAAVVYVTDRADEAGWARLLECDPPTVVESVMDLAAVNLPPNAYKGSAFLAPRWDSKASKIICTSLPGVRGMEEKICSSGKIAAITSNAIREQDHYEIEEGVIPKLVHRRKLGLVDPEANKIVAGYCVITATDGRVHLTVLPIQQKTIEVTGDGGKKYKRTTFERQDTGLLNTDRKPPDVAAAYAAQHSAMRKVGRTWLHSDPGLQAMLNLEDKSYKRGQEIDDSFRITKQDKVEKNSAPVVRDANVTLSTPGAQEIQGEQTEVKSSAAVTV